MPTRSDIPPPLSPVGKPRRLDRPPVGIICDLDGVVYRGDDPIADAVSALKAWHRAGVPTAFVTNNSTRSASDFAAKLNRMGVPTTAESVFDSATATARALRRRFPAGARVFAIGEANLHAALSERGFEPGGEDAAIVVLGFDYGLTFDKLSTAVRAALAGAAVVVTNPDLLTPARGGFEPCVGVLLAAVKAAVPSIQPIIVGKPEPAMILEALAHLGTDPAATVMIGDQIATDIAAGQAAGLHSILVTTGVPPKPHPTIRPDRIVASLLDI